MKTLKWLAMVCSVTWSLVYATAQPAAPLSPGPAPVAGTPRDLSPATSSVIQLAQSGTSEDVLLAFVQDSSSAYNLSADDILYLRDIGVTSPVITAMLNHDHSFVAQQPQFAPAPAAPTPVQTAPPTPAAEPASPPPTFVGNPPPEVSHFYSDLSPYGTWVAVDGIGWCWQPRVVAINHDWRPYCDAGHWVYTDCGWYWQSDYSWGWAPFHYGRWQLDARCGWVWVPDTVWGPAWVTWRVAGDTCGWAPLPPRAVFNVALGWTFNGVHVGVGFDFGLHANNFTFIAVKDFNQHDLAYHRLAPVQVTKIYNNTTIINNYSVHNNTFVNQGIAVTKISSATHTQIHKTVIRDVPADSRLTARGQVFDKGGPVIYRPQLKAPARSSTELVAQKVDARHPVIQHTAFVPPSQTKTGPGNSVWASQPAAASHKPQAQGSQTTEPQRITSYSPSERTPAPSQHQSPRDYATAPTATAPVSTETVHKDSSRVATHAWTAPESAQSPYPDAHEAMGRQSNARQGQSQNPQAYHPKNYQQADDIHSVPSSDKHDSDNHQDKPSRKNND